MKRTLVIGDIHGRHKALMQVLKKSKFDYDRDRLIVLGDVVDGGKDTFKCVEELLKIKDLIYIIGNHDAWFIKFMDNGWTGEIWISQGGANTLRSYGADVIESDYISDNSTINTDKLNIPVTHQDFFNLGVYYYEQDGMLFVHGGINPKVPKITSQRKVDLLWDRHLQNWCREGHDVPGYDKVFIGHTQTVFMPEKTDNPVILNNLYCLDTAAGWNGKLTIMDIHTDDHWQSDSQEIPGRPAPFKRGLGVGMRNHHSASMRRRS